MHAKHVAFFLDQAYGNIVPSLSIAVELMRRGHKVTYTVTESFASLIRSIHANPLIVNMLETRQKTIASVVRENDHLGWKMPLDEALRVVKPIIEERTRHTLNQLDDLFRDDFPDLIVHDDSLDTAGRAFALKLGIPKIRLATQFIEEDNMEMFADDETVLLTVPRFFQRSLELFDADQRFKFVGFPCECRTLPFRPWIPIKGEHRRVLVAPTTGMLQQVEFCRRIVTIFGGEPWDVILALSGSHDKLSTFAPELLGDLPSNVHLNLGSGNFEILRSCQLFIGQGGQGGTLEAIFWGLPQILVPPTPYHHSVARRVVELGLGVCVAFSDMSRETVLNQADALLKNNEVLAAIDRARRSMHDQAGAKLAAQVVEERLAA